MPRIDRFKEVLAFGAVYLIWGSTYLAIAVTVESIPPVFMVALRGVLAGGALYLVLRLRGGAPVSAREMGSALPGAALLFGGGYVLVGWAAQHLDSGVAALLNATVPAFVVVTETVSGARATAGPRVWLGLVVGLAGVGALVWARGGAGGGMNLLAAGVLLLASFFWAFGSVRFGRAGGRDALRSAAVQLMTSGLLLLPVSVLLGEFQVVLQGGASMPSLLALAYLVVFGSLAGFSAYVWLLHHVPARKAASHAYVNPLVAVLLGAWLGHERLDGATALSAVLIVVSVVLVRGETVRKSETAGGTGRLRVAAGRIGKIRVAARGIGRLWVAAGRFTKLWGAAGGIGRFRGTAGSIEKLRVPTGCGG
jgi:drug/metabolite transporter (DMT)-like permease